LFNVEVEDKMEVRSIFNYWRWNWWNEFINV